MERKELNKLIQKWEKKLKKEGLSALGGDRILRSDRITSIINTDKSGLINFLNKLDFWETFQYYYWNFYPKKIKVLDLYIQGQTHSKICQRLHLNYNKVAYLIRCLRREFKTYLQNKSKKSPK